MKKRAGKGSVRGDSAPTGKRASGKPAAARRTARAGQKSAPARTSPKRAKSRAQAQPRAREPPPSTASERAEPEAQAGAGRHYLGDSARGLVRRMKRVALAPWMLARSLLHRLEEHG
jgi:hypothetical protein